MEDGIDNFLICKFTLQPFLENSIMHGLSQKTPEVHISIDLSYGDDTVIIVITDNGIGMAKEQLLELQKTLDEKIGGIIRMCEQVAASGNTLILYSA